MPMNPDRSASWKDQRRRTLRELDLARLLEPQLGQREFIERLVKGMSKRELEELTLLLAELLPPIERGQLFEAAAQITRARGFREWGCR
jgi:hypothetical protein